MWCETITTVAKYAMVTMIAIPAVFVAGAIILSVILTLLERDCEKERKCKEDDYTFWL